VTTYTVVIPEQPSYMEQRTAQIFLEEVEKRCAMSLPLSHALPTEGSFFLFAEQENFSQEFASKVPETVRKLESLPEPGAEGFRVVTAQGGIWGVGADGRGVFYAMARILRKLEMRKGTITCPVSLDAISMTPEYPLRGHQLAYRDKQNTCPAWTVEDFDRYIRDLAFFGSNSIEILPPRTDDNLYSALFHQDPFEVMVELSRRIHSYGMDVWLWYPNMGENYQDPAVLAAEAAEREKNFAAIPYLDHMLIPAGDPGELTPEEFFPVVTEHAKILHKYHPQAKIWIAPQSFAPEPGWLETFYREVAKEPEWLYGICFAPWEKDTLEELREHLPPVYRDRIRHYPDITHNTGCQFEVPQWDPAFAFTLGREGNNTRPRAMKHIHNLHAPHTVGSLTYSEGIHDDVNKMVWGDQDFSTQTSCEETIQDYVRLFISPDLTDTLSELILSLEDNWKGPIRENDNIDRVYRGFEKIASTYGPEVTENARFQLAYLRALSDYQAKRRAARDSALEQDALQVLAQAKELGADSAMERTVQAFFPPFLPEEDQELREKIQKLADSLFQKLHIQLTTWRHGGQRWIRGAYLDSIDFPLNNAQWYCEHFRRIRKLTDESQKLEAIERLLHRTDPGEGGQYIQLGSLEGFRDHVLSDHTWEEDPSFLRSPHLYYDLYGILMNYYGSKGWYDAYPIPLEWVSSARVIYGTPLRVQVEGLDPNASYTLTVAYPQFAVPKAPETMNVTLYAGETLVHQELKRHTSEQPDPLYTFQLPPDSYQDGTLSLYWQIHGTLGPVYVSELWIKKCL
jgi:hypothetical protein